VSYNKDLGNCNKVTKIYKIIKKIIFTKENLKYQNDNPYECLICLVVIALKLNLYLNNYFTGVVSFKW